MLTRTPLIGDYRFYIDTYTLSMLLMGICKKRHSHRGVLLAARGDEQHASGPGTAGVRVGVPGLGIAVVQEHQVKFSLVHRQLEEQRRAHAASRRLEVPLSADAVHGSLVANRSTEGKRKVSPHPQSPSHLEVPYREPDRHCAV